MVAPPRMTAGHFSNKGAAVPGEGRGIKETHGYRLLFGVGSEKNCLCKYIILYLHLYMFVSGDPFSPYHLMFISLKCKIMFSVMFSL